MKKLYILCSLILVSVSIAGVQTLTFPAGEHTVTNSWIGVRFSNTNDALASLSFRDGTNQTVVVSNYQPIVFGNIGDPNPLHWLILTQAVRLKPARLKPGAFVELLPTNGPFNGFYFTNSLPIRVTITN